MAKISFTPPASAQVKEVGSSNTMVAMPQLSVLPLFTIAGVIVALPAASNCTTIKSLQTAVGGTLSCKITFTLQVAVLPDWSVAVSVTVLFPCTSGAPDATDWVMLLTVQLSEALRVVVMLIMPVRWVSSQPASNFGSMARSILSPAVTFIGILKVCIEPGIFKYCQTSVLFRNSLT